MHKELISVLIVDFFKWMLLLFFTHICETIFSSKLEFFILHTIHMLKARGSHTVICTPTSSSQ